MRKQRSINEIIEELFLKGTRTENGCLISHLKTNAKGYVPIQPGGRTGKKWRAHRLVYHYRVEEITDDLLVRHKCDVRNCIEPSHLIKGSAADNTADMMARGRNRNGGKTKVSESMVTEFRELKAKGWTNVAIANKYGISHETVRAYLKGYFTFHSGHKSTVCI